MRRQIKKEILVSTPPKKGEVIERRLPRGRPNIRGETQSKCLRLPKKIVKEIEGLRLPKESFTSALIKVLERGLKIG